jgi:hypothetical protein
VEAAPRRKVGQRNPWLAAVGEADKTFIGRIERGFDFLGYHFTVDNLTLADSTLASFFDHETRLYEQERQRPKTPSPLGAYVKRWCAWTSGGLAGLALGGSNLSGDPVMLCGRAGAAGA